VLQLSAAGLAGCAVTSSLAQVRQDTELLIAGLRNTVLVLAGLPPATIPPATLDAIQVSIQEAANFAADVQSAATTSQAAMPAQSMAGKVAEAVRVAAPLHLPQRVRSIFAAAAALLPSIQAPLGAELAANQAATFYTAAQARQILQQAAFRTV
jgi:hypothetical protein